MSFGLLYNQQDITDLVGKAQASVSKIPPADRNVFNACWNGGLSQWAVAPNAPAQYQEGDTPVKVIVINAVVQGKTVTKEQFAALLEGMVASNPAADFLLSVASDIRTTAIEPWVG